jgi:hypothetical protein
MSQTTTAQYVGNISGYLLEEYREQQAKLEAINRVPSQYSREEQEAHAKSRTVVMGKILEGLEDKGGRRAIQARIMADNGAVFLTFIGDDDADS